jgi:hypothetical protein
MRSEYQRAADKEGFMAYSAPAQDDGYHANYTVADTAKKQA